MRYLLDTNVVIAVTRRDDRNVRRRLSIHQHETALSAIVLHELFYGAFCSDRPDHHLRTIGSIALDVVDFDRTDARVAAEIRAAMRRAGTPIGEFDSLIAGQALARDMTLVTSNLRGFERVEGLRMEDWTAP